MTIGTIEQFKGPFTSPSTVQIPSSSNCKIGISIGEDDFMLLGSSSSDSSLKININGQQIWMGKTYIYEIGQQIDNTVLSFPEGAPNSTIVDVVYCAAYRQ